jgi:hypothetical protein
MTHPLGWPLIPQTLVQRERWPGRLRGYSHVSSLVYPGQEVQPDQPVLRLERGEMLEQVQALPHLPLLTASRQSVDSQGTEVATLSTGPLVLPAGLRGRVVDVTRRGGVVIESSVLLLQGVLGAGRQVAGVLTMWQQGRTRRPSQPLIPPGALLVVPGPLTFTLLRQAQSSGVAGIIASSIAFSDFEGFLRTDAIQLLDTADVELAQSRLPDLTLLLTEGLGSIAMPTHIINMLSTHQGSIALLSGVTAWRSQLVPELVISLPAQKLVESPPTTIYPELSLTLGAMVRVCNGEQEGSIGIIDYFFTYEQIFPSGVYARALRIKLEDGLFLTLPVSHVQRIK